jgi:hypothetical protein
VQKETGAEFAARQRVQAKPPLAGQARDVKSVVLQWTASYYYYVKY